MVRRCCIAQDKKMLAYDPLGSVVVVFCDANPELLDF